MNTPQSNLEELLNRLDALDASAAKAGPEGTRKRPPRLRYRQPNLALTASHHESGVIETKVCTRNLCDDSVGCIASVFVHVGSPCTITLKFDHQTLEVPGMITRCRPLAGALHEVEIAFDSPINVAALMTQASRETRAWISTLHGKVLYVDDMPMDLLLVQHYLRETQTQLTLVKTWAEVQDAMLNEEFDVVMVDLNLMSDVDGVTVIRQLREGNYNGPIIVISGETNPVRLAAADAAGSTHRLTKPYEAHELHTVLGSALASAGIFAESDALYSTMGNRADMADAIDRFVRHLGDCADKLEYAIATADSGVARRVCLELKGSAAGFGFGSIGMLARAVFETMEVESEVRALAPRLLALTRMCRSARARKAAKTQVA